MTVEDPVIGPDPPAGAVPPIRRAPHARADRRPRLGADNRQVWCDLVGLSDAEFDQLTRDGIL